MLLNNEWVNKEIKEEVKRYTQTKSKGVGKDISCKWKGKKKLG